MTRKKINERTDTIHIQSKVKLNNDFLYIGNSVSYEISYLRKSGMRVYIRLVENQRGNLQYSNISEGKDQLWIKLTAAFLTRIFSYQCMEQTEANN